MHVAIPRLGVLLAFILTGFMLSGCCEQIGAEPPADIQNPKTYRKGGLSFSYPGNWTITEDSEDGGIRSVFIETPGDALMTIQVYPEASAQELKDYAKAFSEKSDENMPVIDMGSSDVTPLSDEGGYTRLEETFVVSLLGVDIPHTRMYRKRACGDRVVFVMTQVADEDRDKTEAGFAQVATSFNCTK
ncbi:MAG: hypothetical protein AAFX99_18375 [Myxococcota bacterium]